MQGKSHMFELAWIGCALLYRGILTWPFFTHDNPCWCVCPKWFLIMEVAAGVQSQVKQEHVIWSKSLAPRCRCPMVAIDDDDMMSLMIPLQFRIMAWSLTVWTAPYTPLFHWTVSMRVGDMSWIIGQLQQVKDMLSPSQIWSMLQQQVRYSLI